MENEKPKNIHEQILLSTYTEQMILVDEVKELISKVDEKTKLLSETKQAFLESVKIGITEHVNKEVIRMASLAPVDELLEKIDSANTQMNILLTKIDEMNSKQKKSWWKITK